MWFAFVNKCIINEKSVLFAVCRDIPMKVSAGFLMLAGDLYLRVHAIIFAHSSTDPIALIFIPFWVGGCLLPLANLIDWLIGER